MLRWGRASARLGGLAYARHFFIHRETRGQNFVVRIKYGLRKRREDAREKLMLFTGVIQSF